MPITTGIIRLSYCHVWQPQVPQSGGDPKYSVTLLIPKSDASTLNAIYTDIESTKQNGIGAVWGGNLPPIVKLPIYDGDGVRPSGEPFGEECRGHMVLTASSKTQPHIVDSTVQPILSQSQVYSGCFARVSINFFAYNQAGNKGIGCGLNGVQKMEDGEPLAGGVSAQEAFGGRNACVPQAPTYPQQPSFQQPMYQAPTFQQPSFQQPMYQAPIPQGLDPITGQPLIGKIMGI